MKRCAAFLMLLAGAVGCFDLPATPGSQRAPASSPDADGAAPSLDTDTRAELDRPLTTPTEDVRDADIAETAPRDTVDVPSDALDEQPPAMPLADVPDADVVMMDALTSDVVIVDAPSADTPDTFVTTGDVPTDRAMIVTDSGCNCPLLTLWCGDRCVDTNTHTSHCGRCGNACAGAETCTAGRCVCPTTGGFMLCGGVCVNSQSDARHCGVCGRACAAAQACVAGVCVNGQRSCPDPSDRGCGMVAVSAGMLTLGHPGALGASPSPGAVTLSTNFRVDRYEVTIKRFRQYVQAGMPGVPGGVVEYPGGRRVPWIGPPLVPSLAVAADADRVGCNWTSSPGDREYHPVNCVDQVTAQAFCVWDGGRLPTEAELELAARGTDGRAWPWGNDADTDRRPGPLRICSYRRGPLPCQSFGTCEVDDPEYGDGVSPSGVWQMVGNVWEWTADTDADYVDPDCWGAMRRIDPVCDRGDGFQNRSLRGGAWGGSVTMALYASARLGTDQRTIDDGNGFRCVRTR